MDHCIGDNGQLPWHLPDELAHFEATTMGKTLVMGRKTYEDQHSTLAGRFNIVVSGQPGYEVADGVALVTSPEKALELATTMNREVFVIGGIRLFTAALSVAQRVYETVVEAEIDGETVLPAIDYSEWDTEILSIHPRDERHEFAYKVYLHTRR